MFYYLFYFLGLVAGILSIILHPLAGIEKIANTILLYQLIITVGLSGIFGYLGHVFKSEEVAATIGWASNGFQKELGFVSLGIGLSGIMCFWIRDNFWLAVIIIFSTFFLGAAYGHIKEMIISKNCNHGNTKVIIPDIIIPCTLIILWILTHG